jgi:hypothetical protein
MITYCRRTANSEIYLDTVHVWVTIQSLISVQCTSEAQAEKKKTGSALIHRRTRLNETVSYVSLSQAAALSCSTTCVHSAGHQSGLITFTLTLFLPLMRRDEFCFSASSSLNKPIPWEPSEVFTVPIFFREASITTSEPGATACSSSDNKCSKISI